MKSADKKLVMIIEDDAILRRGLARILSSDEFVTSELDDGSRAMTVIAGDAPDLILCDYRLPGFDGLEVLRRVRLLARHIPFILITAHYSEQLAKDAAAGGADAVLEKPLDLSQLRELCRQLLGIDELKTTGKLSTRAHPSPGSNSSSC